ncbi:MAG: spermidine/putrescine ABC transporter substrate-binding protein [Halofilum sp. (in: g-proteobacteria)]|nr:spermidine/putrescine ABC transporter substrate-binding protein [Halofilum sp. (in: g-proteobacteria)]
MRTMIRSLAMSMLLTLGLAAGTSAMAQEKTLYIFNWSQYMDPEIIEAFEQKHDVKIVRNFYNSLPEMFSKLRAGGDSQYDIIVPSNYFVPRLIETGLVQKLDHSKIPNLDNLHPKFRDPSFDPGNQYSAAFQWGTTGLIYNKETLGEHSDTWGIMFDPKANTKYPFAMIGDGQVTMGMACAYLGFGYRCTDREQWKKAAKLVLETKKRENFSGFNDGTPQLQQIAQGVIHAGMSYNGDYVFFKSEDPEAYEDIGFSIPKEGAEIWVDNMMIPANAPNPDLAHTFINYILDAEVGAQLSNWTYYSSPNKAALPMLDEVLQQPPSTPTDAELKRSHFTPSLSGEDLQVFQQLWTEVQSR